MTIANKEKTPIKIMPPRRTIISKMMEPLNKVVERLIPSALIFAIGLTVAVLLMALWLTPSSPSEVLQEWGTGLSGLLEFMTQMALMLFLGFMLAHTKPFSRLLTWLARVPNTPMQAYLFVFLLAAMASLVTWGLGLVVGGLMARKVGEEAKRRSIQAHFPMLVASGFSGFIVQHMGYTGVGPLTAATPGSFLAEHLGQPLSTSETIYSSWNLVAILIVIAVVAATLYAIAPRGVKVIPFSGEIVEETTKAQESEKTPAERLDSSRIFTLVLGVILMLYVIQYFATGGELILDIVNWTFLALVFLLVRSPVEVIQLARSAATNVGEILLQFPLYAGILGVMSGTGLMAVISGWFIQFASPEMLPIVAFLSAGLVNMAVPSGGGQFAVQGPLMLDAAAASGVDPAIVIMAVAYGDQWTNMIQPFWALPLLAIAGLRIRDILGYTTAVLVTSGIAFLGILFVVGTFII
ncbi:short-chain fatty acid transporter [Enteractinococcus coprophilus]|uniref:Short-chain fatty acids transporter n=1 Tax=Enteractinococcus coprophilus TaxID=1027633 RepID=A0A543AP03_9MICC|nr:short-chain fatty acids transporter [Enteractinococcus coprophilus]